jgi:hypothetical protein
MRTINPVFLLYREVLLIVVEGMMEKGIIPISGRLLRFLVAVLFFHLAVILLLWTATMTRPFVKQYYCISGPEYSFYFKSIYFTTIIQTSNLFDLL